MVVGVKVMSVFIKEQCMEIYRQMQLIRRFEENAVKLGDQGEILGSLHLYCGQEAIAVGLCFGLDKSDLILSTHRGHGHLIAMGGETKYMFSELMGKINGYNKGKGGSMHIAAPDLGMLGANGIVGGGAPIAVGVALANKIKKNKKVVVTFFGDGALGTGALHEAMNMAAIWNLPILFICENNQYGMTSSVKNSCPIKKLKDRAKAYGFPGITADGMDVEKVFKTSQIAIKRARDNEGPTFIEFKTYRFYDHSIGLEKLKLAYRTDEEVGYWKSRCPVKSWHNKLVREEICKEEELNEIDNTIENNLSEAIEFARASSFPEPEDALKDMYADEYKGIPDSGVIRRWR